MSDQERANLIFMVESANFSISKASSILGLNYTNAMAIMRVYRKENRSQSNRPAQPMTMDSKLISEAIEILASLEDKRPSTTSEVSKDPLIFQ